ncbi:MAG: flippase-like domain-containing protein [Bacilli bacterium]|nr:flippase-like domain-containing protein [Bacilli bacterium]
MGKKKKDSKLKYLIYFVVIIGATVGILLYSLLKKTNYQGNEVFTYEVVKDLFKTINPYFFLAFFGILILINFFGAFAIYMYTRLYTAKVKFMDSVATRMVYIFYNGITPGDNTGGEFAEAATLKKQGIHISNAASIVVTQYIVYQFSIFILSALSLFEINEVLNIGILKIGSFEIPIVIFVIASFALNVLLFGSALFMSISRRFHNFVIYKVLAFLAKIKIVKNLEKTQIGLRVSVENFRRETRRLLTNIPFTILIFLVTLIIISLNYLYPFFVGLSMGAFNDGFNVALKMWESIAFSNFQHMVVGLIPIPGGAGTSEYVFNYLFTGYYSNAFIEKGGTVACMLVWRTFTFYIPLFMGALAILLYRPKGQKDFNQNIYNLDRKTFHTLQIETYNLSVNNKVLTSEEEDEMVNTINKGDKGE